MVVKEPKSIIMRGAALGELSAVQAKLDGIGLKKSPQKKTPKLIYFFLLLSRHLFLPGLFHIPGVVQAVPSRLWRLSAQREFNTHKSK